MRATSQLAKRDHDPSLAGPSKQPFVPRALVVVVSAQLLVLAPAVAAAAARRYAPLLAAAIEPSELVKLCSWSRRSLVAIADPSLVVQLSWLLAPQFHLHPSIAPAFAAVAGPRHVPSLAIWLSRLEKRVLLLVDLPCDPSAPVELPSLAVAAEIAPLSCVAPVVVVPRVVAGRRYDLLLDVASGPFERVRRAPSRARKLDDPLRSHS